jgi:hypothetical protein
MFTSPGRRLPLSVARRFIGDVMRAAAKVPIVMMERRMSLAPLLAARKAVTPRIGWCAIFTKAYALVARKHAELRRAYLSFPRPHLYEHPESIAAVAVERRFDGQKCVFFAHVPSPEQLGLRDLEATLQHFKEFPVPGINSYRLALHVSRWPRPLRRLAWWFGLNVSGPLRAQYIGTFGVTVTAGLGASALYIPSPLTTTLHYGTFEKDGTLPIRLAFDHRVLDGGHVCRVLKDMEQTLLGQIARELSSSPPVLGGRGVGGEGVIASEESAPSPQPLSPETGARGYSDRAA